MPAAGRDEAAADPEIAGPAPVEPGAWRSKVQQKFDPQTRTLSRQLYTIWDAEPSRDRDFTWTPDRPQADKPGRINGSGLLTWRIKGKPTYDPAAIVAQYRGAIRGGHIEGFGIFLDRDGLFYEGEWKAGLMHGQGRLQLPGGDEYVGEFRAGQASGSGRYIDASGEILRRTVRGRPPPWTRHHDPAEWPQLSLALDPRPGRRNFPSGSTGAGSGHAPARRVR